MSRTALTVFVATLLGAVAGLALGSLLGNIILGVVTGALVAFPLGLFLVSRRRRWIAASLLNLVLIVSYQEGGAFALGSTVAAAGLSFSVAAFIIRDVYGGSEFAALGHHVRLALGIVQGLQVIEDGKTVHPKGTGPLLGPRMLIIRPGSAVVTVKGRTRAAYGADFFTSQPFEYVKFTYHLGEQQKTLSFNDVLTSDLMPVTVRVSITYALDVSEEARLGRAAVTEAEQQMLCQIPFNMPDWQGATHGALEQAVRQSLQAVDMENLLTCVHTPRLETRLLDFTNRRTNLWGVRVRRVIVEQIATHAELTTALDSRWRESAGPKECAMH